MKKEIEQIHFYCAEIAIESIAPTVCTREQKGKHFSLSRFQNVVTQCIDFVAMNRTNMTTHNFKRYKTIYYFDVIH